MSSRQDRIQPRHSPLSAGFVRMVHHCLGYSNTQVHTHRVLRNVLRFSVRLCDDVPQTCIAWRLHDYSPPHLPGLGEEQRSHSPPPTTCDCDASLPPCAARRVQDFGTGCCTTCSAMGPWDLWPVLPWSLLLQPELQSSNGSPTADLGCEQHNGS